MKKLSSELGLKVSLRSFAYVKDVVTYYIKEKSWRSKNLFALYEVVAEKYGVSPEAVTMGVFRFLQNSIHKIELAYPNINPSEKKYSIECKEILVRLADICEEKGCEF